MKKYAFAVRSPLEVGDVILARLTLTPRAASRVHEVVDILTIHSARDGGVRIMYQLDQVDRLVPLDYIEGRIVDGQLVPLDQEKMASKEVMT